MAQLVVRNLEPGVKEHLRVRAAEHGHSLEQEVWDILRRAVEADKAGPCVGLGTRISRLFAGLGLTEEIPELRGQEARPVDFGQ